MQAMTKATTPTAPTTIDEYHEHLESHWSRNRISRRTALKGALVGAGAIALTNFPSLKKSFAAGGGVSGPSGAVLVGRHVSFVSSRDLDPTNSMRVTTQAIFPAGVVSAGLKAYVRYGQGGDLQRVRADIVNLAGVVPNAPQGTLAGNQFYVKALIKDLRPGTSYTYRVELSDGTTTGDATFTTAPDRSGLGEDHGKPVPAAFTFTSFGDHGTNTAPTDPTFAYSNATAYTWAKASFDDNYYSGTDPVLAYDATPAITMTSLVAAQNPVFHLMNGDVCYADPSGTGLPVDNTLAVGGHGRALPGTNAYNPYVWDVYLAQIEASAANVPWMIATGNHDMEALYGNHGYGGHQSRLDMPQNGPSGCPSVYSFVYANVGVISVDANDLSFEIPTNLGYSGGAQYSWVESTLKAWRKDKSIDFIVMFMHHCAFSTSGAHASDLGVRSLVGTLADQYQVDLVLSGHNHQVERTNPIRNGKSAADAPDGSTVDGTLGTTYLTIGSGGRPRYLWQNTGHGLDTTGTSDRYRGRTSGDGANTAFVGTKTYTGVGTTGTEDVDWSQTRYLDYALARVDVVPAKLGRTTTMTVTVVADGDRMSNLGGVPIDSVVFTRTAGASGRA
jgi:hypothetical protein